MAKKRTTLPFYTKAMTRVNAAARRSGDFNLVLYTSQAVRAERIKRAMSHLKLHSWPRPLAGTDYGSIHPSLGMFARYL